MDQPRSSELFSLTIDPQTKLHLVETAKWARFLAIVGLIALGLAVIFVIAGFGYLFTYGQGPGHSDYGTSSTMHAMSSYAIGMILLYALITVFPLLFLLRFANRMLSAIEGNDQQLLNHSFLNLKACFRYLGIVTIIVIALQVLAVALGILGTAAMP